MDSTALDQGLTTPCANAEQKEKPIILTSEFSGPASGQSGTGRVHEIALCCCNKVAMTVHLKRKVRLSGLKVLEISVHFC